MEFFSRLGGWWTDQWQGTSKTGKLAMLVVPLFLGCCGMTMFSALVMPDERPEPEAVVAGERRATVDVGEDPATAEPTRLPATAEPSRVPATATARPSATPRPSATSTPTAVPSLVSAMDGISAAPITVENTGYVQELYYKTTLFAATEISIHDFILDGDITSDEAPVLTSTITQALGTLREIHALEAPSDLQSVHQFAGSSLSPCLDLLAPMMDMLSGGGGGLVYSNESCHDSLVEVLEIVDVYRERNPDMVLESALASTVAAPAISAGAPAPTALAPTIVPATAVPSAVAPSTAVPTVAPLPTATLAVVAAAGDVIIASVRYDGDVPQVESDEYAVIMNRGGTVVNIGGWRLNAGEPDQNFVFPNFDLQPGQSCRVYTNEAHPESCGFSFGRGDAIWRNSGDCGFLYNVEGVEVSRFCW